METYSELSLLYQKNKKYMNSLFFPANLLLILILKRTKFSLRVVNKENENIVSVSKDKLKTTNNLFYIQNY